MKKWLSVALLAAMATFNGQAELEEVIAVWDFESDPTGDDGEFLASAEGNNYQAVIMGDAELSANGEGHDGGRGFDASLDTDGYITFEGEGEDNPLNLAAANDQISIVFWQKNRSNPNASTFWSITETEGRWFQAHVPWSNGQIYFDSMGCCTNPTQRINGDPGADHEWIEEWHHYAFVKNEDYKAVYVDGALLLETADGGATPLTVEATQFWIGSDNAGGNQPDAIIDDVAIIKGALSEDDINGIIDGSIKLTEPPADTDGDGIPDRWEEQWGFDPNDPSDASEDPDEDGDDNLTEFTNKTDPLDTTDPTLLDISNDCSLTTIVLTFSEKLNEATATDAGNYSIDPAVAIESIAFKKNTVTITTATQDVNAAYTVTVNNIADESKNTVAADTSAKIYTCFETTDGVLKFSAWLGIGGTSIDTIFDDGRYPNDPDIVGPVFSFNSDDYPKGALDNYAGEIEGWITPTESGDYDFFLWSDDASELWISTDDSEGNLEFQAEELNCCNIFQEPGVDQTTFQPLSLVAGESYFIQALYKEGGGGDYVRVAWRKTDDDTPAADLQPIPGTFLSSEVPLLIPAEGSFGARAPGAGATVDPGLGTISISHNNGAFAWTADNTSLAINGNEVETTFSKEGVAATLTHTLPEGLLPSSAEMVVTLTYPDPVGEPITESWSFNVLEYRGPIHSTVGEYPGLVTGAAVSTEDGGGHSGSAGDRGMDFTADGGSIIVTDYDWLNPAFAGDALTVVYWVKKHVVQNGVPFFISSTGAVGGGNRAYSAHVPWAGNPGTIYFDTAGCCGADTRINANVVDFDDNPDFWNDWHLISLSKDGGNKEIRIDGDLFFDGIDAAPLDADVTSLTIGAAQGGGNPDTSIFDDFAIFDTALSEADIKTIVDGGSPADLADKGLLAYWDFNEAIGGGGGEGNIGGVSLQDGMVVIEFEGTLKSSSTINGDFSAVAGATSPYSVAPDGDQAFFIAE